MSKVKTVAIEALIQDMFPADATRSEVDEASEASSVVKSVALDAAGPAAAAGSSTQSVKEALEKIVSDDGLRKKIESAIANPGVNKLSKKDLKADGLDYSIIFLKKDEKTDERQPYLVAQQLGRGGKGAIKMAYNLSTGEKAALKIVKNVTTDDEPVKKEEFNRERTVLGMFHRFMGYAERVKEANTKLYLAQDLIQGFGLDAAIRAMQAKATDSDVSIPEKQELAKNVLAIGHRVMIESCVWS